MKIAVASGKGGVGKSMLTSSLVILFGKKKKIIAVDCDVDAPNLAIWLNEMEEWERFIPVTTSFKPELDYKKCKSCNLCAEKCRFKAIKIVRGKPTINPFLCEGCGVCEMVCPQGAINLKPVQNGEIKIKKTKYGFTLIEGNLFPGETGSGKIIAELKKEADKKRAGLYFFDCSPGTGCPVIACLRDSDFVILVTEPTPSSFSDLRRVMELVGYFNLPYKIVINKWNINPQVARRIEKWAGKHFLEKISYNKEIFKAVANLTPVLETNLDTKKEIEAIFKKLRAYLASNKHKFIYG